MVTRSGALAERAGSCGRSVHDLASVTEGLPIGGWSLGPGQTRLVSVIVPVFNRATLLRETLDSVRAQTYRPIELIIVDDGSSDDSVEVVRGWISGAAREDDFEAFLAEGPNRGSSAARNEGTRRSRGEYIQYLDSDDTLHPDKIAIQVAALTVNPRYEFAYGPVCSMEEPERQIYAQSQLSYERSLLKQLVVPSFQTNGPLFRRAGLERVGPWDTRLQMCNDWEFHTRTVLRGLHGLHTPDAHSYYRTGNEGQERLRWDGEPHRIGEYAYENLRRLASADSLIARSNHRVRKARKVLGMQQIVLTADLVRLGWVGDDRELYRLGLTYLPTGVPRTILGVVPVLRRMLGRRILAMSMAGMRRATFMILALVRKIRGCYARPPFRIGCAWMTGSFRSQGIRRR